MENEMNIRQIQLAELEILKKFIAFCKKHNLTYWLYGGTALGAVRHRGFIPWDDDIDIIMPRDDYERLVKEIEDGEKIGNNIKAEFPETTKKPRLLIGKLYDTTIRVEAANGHDSGFLWIDIMQLDGLPNKPKHYLNKLMLLRKLYLAKMRQVKKVRAKNESWLKHMAKRTKRLPLHLINYNLLIRYMLKYCKKYRLKESKLASNTCWYNTPSKIYKTEWFNGVKKIKFEDIQANIMPGYNEYLEKRYGNDYMKIPAKKYQITHSIKAWPIEKKDVQS